MIKLLGHWFKAAVEALYIVKIPLCNIDLYVFLMLEYSIMLNLILLMNFQCKQ